MKRQIRRGSRGAKVMTFESASMRWRPLACRHQHAIDCAAALRIIKARRCAPPALRAAAALTIPRRRLQMAHACWPEDRGPAGELKFGSTQTCEDDGMNEQQTQTSDRSMPDSEDVLTYREAAALLKVSARTLARWTREGRVPYIRLPKRGAWSGVRFSRAHLLRWLRQRTVKERGA